MLSQICSFRLVFSRRASPRRSPVSFGPATSSHGHAVLHARCATCTRQGSLSLDQRVWVTACFPGCGWGFFSGSEVFRRVFCCRGGLWWRHTVCKHRFQRRCHPTPVSMLASVLGCLRFFLVCLQFASVMLKCYWTICWLRC
jgi:hypothetical protein